MLKTAYIGCSGCYYREWKGLFYPEDIPASKWLDYYCLNFSTVEINASFYKFPELKGMQAWYKKTPPEFAFTVKAFKGITHFKKFNGVAEEIKKFYDVISEGLQEKLKSVLFQLPPSLSYTEEILQMILESFDLRYTNILECRHISWWNVEVFKLLKKHKIVFCNISHPVLPEEFIDTGDICYLRFHGNKELYKSNYSEKELQSWADQVEASKTKKLFAYFNNTWGGNAIGNCLTFEKMLGSKS
jgi:uncharacterized protein YecE (DUF72 family)